MSDEVYYKDLRQASYLAAEKVFIGQGKSIKLTGIDAKAVDASYSEKFTWFWDDDDNSHVAVRFEVAVWETRRLTALCRGKPIKMNSKLCLEIIEASPSILASERTPVLAIVSLCASVYARMIGAEEVRLMEPTSKSRIRLYERYGYTYVPSGDYLVKKV